MRALGCCMFIDQHSKITAQQLQDDKIIDCSPQRWIICSQGVDWCNSWLCTCALLSFHVLTIMSSHWVLIIVLFALSAVWSAAPNHDSTTSPLSEIIIWTRGKTSRTIDTLLSETWAHQKAHLSPWTGFLTHDTSSEPYRDGQGMQRAAAFIWKAAKTSHWVGEQENTSATSLSHNLDFFNNAERS